ncbi:MAG: DMT family protein [Ruminobacter sp.]|jgi:hypothetical protein|nr:DMT family protein [Ruminobacter sp.]
MWYIVAGCVFLLVISNVFQNIAWYGHLSKLSDQPVYIAILVSWLIALIEYALMVPANRYAHDYFTVGQLKIMQEVITLTVFVPLSITLFGEKWNWDYLWAALCMVGAVFFAFRSKLFA